MVKYIVVSERLEMKKAFFLLYMMFHINLFANEIEKNFLETITPIRDDLSTLYCHTLQRLDNYLGDDNDTSISMEDAYYKNSLQMIFVLNSSSDSLLAPSLYLRGNIVLPRTNNRLELVFSKQDEDKFENEKLGEEYDPVLDHDQKVNMGLRYNFSKDKDFHIFTKVGMRLRPPMKVYVKTQIDNDFDLNYFQLNTGTSLYYYIKEKGLKYSAWLKFYKKLNDTWFLKQGNQYIWEHDNIQKEFLSTVDLEQSVDIRNSFRYSLGYLISNKDQSFSTKEYFASILYRHHFNKWLYVDMVPQLNFKRENDFDTEVAFALHLSVSLYR
jgi:hypothetical protein